MSEQTALERKACTSSSVSASLRNISASATATAIAARQPQRLRTTPQQRPCFESPCESNSVTLNSVSVLPEQMLSGVNNPNTSSSSNQEEERRGFAPPQQQRVVFKVQPPIAHDAAVSNRSSTSVNSNHNVGGSTKASPSPVCQANRCARDRDDRLSPPQVEKGDATPEKTSGTQEPFRDGTLAEPTTCPGVVVGTALVSLTEDNRGFLNPEDAKGMSSDDVENNNDETEDDAAVQERDNPSYEADAKAHVQSPSEACFPLTDGERQAVSRAFESYTAAGTASAFSREHFVTLLRELDATTRESTGLPASGAIKPFLSAEELLDKAETSLGTVRFREVLRATETQRSSAINAVTVAASSAASLPYLTLADAFRFFGVLKFELWSHLFGEKSKANVQTKSDDVASSTATTTTKSEVTDKRTTDTDLHQKRLDGASPAFKPSVLEGGDEQQQKQRGNTSTAFSTEPTVAAQKTPPQPPISPLRAKTSSSVLTASQLTFFPFAVTHRSNTNPPHATPALSSTVAAGSGATPMSAETVTTAAMAVNTFGLEATAPAPSPNLKTDQSFLPSLSSNPDKHGEAKRRPPVRRGGQNSTNSSRALHGKASPSVLSAARRSHMGSFFCRDLAVRNYVMRRAFAELAEGQCGSHRYISFERLSEALQLLELSLRPDAVARVCDGIQLDENGSIKGDRIEFASFERIMEAGLQYPLDGSYSEPGNAEGTGNSKANHAREKGGATPDLFHLLLPNEIATVFPSGGGINSNVGNSGDATASAVTAADDNSGPSLRDNHAPSRLGLPAVVSFCSASRSHSNSSLATSSANLTKSGSEVDDAYPVIATQDSAMAALCREIRWRLRTAAARHHSSMHDSAEGKASMIGATSEDSPLPPPPPPPFSSSPLLGESAAAPAGADPPSSVAGSSSGSQVTSSTSSSPSFAAQPADINLKKQHPYEKAGQEPPRQDVAIAKPPSPPRCPISANNISELSPSQKHRWQHPYHHSQHRYRHNEHSPYLHALQISRLQAFSTHNSFQQWQREMVPPPAAAQWTAPHPYCHPPTAIATSKAAVATTTPNLRRCDNNANNNSYNNHVDLRQREHNTATYPRYQRSPQQKQQQPRWPKLPFGIAPQNVVARRPSRLPSCTTAAFALARGSGSFVQQQHQPHNNSLRFTPHRILQPRSSRWESITALSPYYTPASKTGLHPSQQQQQSHQQHWSRRSDSGVYAHLAGKIQAPGQHISRLVHDDASPSVPHTPLQTPLLSTGLAEGPTMPPRLRSSSALSSGSLPSSRPSTELGTQVVSAIANDDNSDRPANLSSPSSHPFAPHATPHLLLRSTTLPLTASRPQQQQQQRIGVSLGHSKGCAEAPLLPPTQTAGQPTQLPRSLYAGAHETVASSSAVPVAATISTVTASAPSDAYHLSLASQLQRREWVLAELAELYVAHKALTQRLASLSTLAASSETSRLPVPQQSPSGSSTLPSILSCQERQQEALECEAALNEVSRLIHRHLTELAVGDFTVNDFSDSNITNIGPQCANEPSSTSSSCSGAQRRMREAEEEEYLAYAIAEACRAAFTAAERVDCCTTIPSPIIGHNSSRPPRVPVREATTTVATAVTEKEQGSPEEDERGDKSETSPQPGSTGSPLSKSVSTAAPSFNTDPFSDLKSNCEASDKGLDQPQLQQVQQSSNGSARVHEGLCPADPPSTSLQDSGIFSGPPRSEDGNLDFNSSSTSLTHVSSQPSTMRPGADLVHRLLSQRPQLPDVLAFNGSITRSSPSEPLSAPDQCKTVQNGSNNAVESLKLLTTNDNNAPVMKHSSSGASANDDAQSPKTSTALPEPTTRAAMNAAEGMYDDDSPSPRANIYLEWAVTQLEQRQRQRMQQRRGNSDTTSDFHATHTVTGTTSASGSFTARLRSAVLPHSGSCSIVLNGHAHQNSTNPSTSAAAAPATATTTTNSSWPASRVYCTPGVHARPPMSANRSTASSGRALPSPLNASRPCSGGSEPGLASILTERQSHSLLAPLTVENDVLRSDDRPLSHCPGSMTTLTDESPLLGCSTGDRNVLLHRSVAAAGNSRSHPNITSGHLTSPSLGSNSILQVLGVNAPLDFTGSTTWSNAAQSRAGTQALRSSHGSALYRMTRSTARQYGGLDNQRSYSTFERTVSSILPAGFSGSMFLQRDADGNVINDGD